MAARNLVRSVKMAPVGRTPANEILTASEVADWLDQNIETVQRAAKAGRLPARRIGKEWRFLRDDVAETRGLRIRRRPGADEADLPRSPFDADAGIASAGMDSEEAARFLRTKEWTVRSEANQGRLPGWREGQRWRFSRDELIEHMRTDEPEDRTRYDRRTARERSA
ncbi:MAG: helix-turn-helix domain-containing protein [Dehalococcoidia bacterium]